jgi:chromosome condensin MukBEF MukE localization factor
VASCDLEREVGLRVGTSVGHGEKTRALVADLEVLVGKLLAVDGLSTGALDKISIFSTIAYEEGLTYVTTGEVTTLEHELGNDTVERRALVGQDLASVVCESLAELSKVLGSSGDDIVVELEFDTTCLGW